MPDFTLDTPGGHNANTIPTIDFKAQLNADQFNAVTAPPGPLLVLAGAGSGKTRTLTYRVAYLLSQGVRPGEILLLTFTNKAAKEMLHRVHDLTGIEPARFWGGTFHSLGNRALRIYGDAIKLPKNFTILDADESESLLKQSVEAVDFEFVIDDAHWAVAHLAGARRVEVGRDRVANEGDHVGSAKRTGHDFACSERLEGCGGSDLATQLDGGEHRADVGIAR